MPQLGEHFAARIPELDEARLPRDARRQDLVVGTSLRENSRDRLNYLGLRRGIELGAKVDLLSWRKATDKERATAATRTSRERHRGRFWLSSAVTNVIEGLFGDVARRTDCDGVIERPPRSNAAALGHGAWDGRHRT